MKEFLCHVSTLSCRWSSDLYICLWLSLHLIRLRAFKGALKQKSLNISGFYFFLHATEGIFMAHRIHSVSADGPVGQTGKILAGDFLIEVNGVNVLDMTHPEVVKLIQTLPRNIRLIVARYKDEQRKAWFTCWIVFFCISRSVHLLFVSKQLKQTERITWYNCVKSRWSNLFYFFDVFNVPSFSNIGSFSNQNHVIKIITKKIISFSKMF